MTTEILVAELERKGVRLVVQGQKLKLQAPADRVPGAKTITELRDNKAAILEYLRRREQASEIQFSSFPTPMVGKTEKLESVAGRRGKSARWKDFYEWRMGVAISQLCEPGYPAGVIQWLAAFSPALHSELTSRLPDRIQRLWETQAPYSDFEATCTELVECHRSAVELFRSHLAVNYED